MNKMAKKAGDDFNFKGSKIDKLSQLRQTDKTSFFIRPDKTLYPKDPCDGLHINNIPDLLHKGGRKDGEIVEYDPVQKKNYLSISERFERSLYLIPEAIEKRDNKLIYKFCTSNSPTGYWEVEVGAGATFLTLTNPILTIICPRPFQLQDFTGVDTDGTFISWTQLQGRTVIISPNTGDGSLNPFISIIGIPNDLTPPILIQADAEADPTVTDTLLIYTSPTDNYKGIAIAHTGQVTPDCYSPQVEITPFSTLGAFCYDGRSLQITWKNPTCDGQYAVSYSLLENTTGQYVSIGEFLSSDTRIATVEANTHYRIDTAFKVRGRTTSKRSKLIYFPYTPGGLVHSVFADDSHQGLAIARVGGTYSKRILTATTYIYEDTYNQSLSFARVGGNYSKIPLSLQRQYLEESYNRGLSFTRVGGKITKIDLGGVIIG